MTEKEIWKDVVGYDNMYKGMYQVSNLGRVRSLDRINNIGRRVDGRILKYGDSGDGYKIVVLTKNAKSRTVKVHRLVAMAFVENKNNNNKLVVNHIDEDKYNNNSDNLEWVTQKENVNYGTGLQRMAKTHYKPIKVIYSDDTYEIWPSSIEFAEYAGIRVQSIYRVLSGGRPHTHGMRFERVEK